ncbi:transketolase [Nitrosospira sp. Nl5]|uniref:transketolase family protein n=1 Tax=Nitrosospira sp. Nl5 TaxID=200120 RepID=UPI000890DC1C|nr:transketolase C-terminal domain-containing protein [Nitrosospira sp. Nl5]SCY20888.1 transketolase [Nitrosospira sp. Nl5]
MSALLPLKPRAMRDTLLEATYEAMLRDSGIFFVTADFGSPVIDKIRTDCSARFVNVGIAEQNLINVSAGLALEGFKVFAYAIAPFITMRCYEQIRVNLSLLSEVRPINVNLIGVGAGYSYVVSGPTHQCYEDLTVMRALPNMRIFSPADQVVAAALPALCLDSNGPKYLRLDAQVLPVLYEISPALDSGFHVHRKGDKICLIATGYMVHTALKVADKLAASGLSVGVVDLFDLCSFSEDKLQSMLASYQGVVTMEEGFRGRGGMDAMMFDYIARRGINVRMFNIGVEGGYRFELGERSVLHEKVGIGVESVTGSVERFERTFSASSPPDLKNRGQKVIA